MKEDIRIFLILTFMVSQICYAQFPPAKYAIKKEDIENNFTSYKFYGGRFNGNQAELNNELSFSKYDEILQTGYMYIYSYIVSARKPYTPYVFCKRA
jgi:hypothetical protein